MINYDNIQHKFYCFELIPIRYQLIENNIGDVLFKFGITKNMDVLKRFDTDTFWTIDGELNFSIPLYSPWFSLNQYNGTPIPVESVDVSLDFFDEYVIPVVQRDTRIYLQPSSNGRLSGKRIVGPISPQILNDTITVYSEVLWEAGSNYRVKDDLFAKIIIE